MEITSEEYRVLFNEGYTQVVDLDLAKYFDTVNHEILVGMLREQIKDERVSTPLLMPKRQNIPRLFSFKQTNNG